MAHVASSVFRMVQALRRTAPGCAYGSGPRYPHHVVLAPGWPSGNAGVHPFFRKNTVIRSDWQESITRQAFAEPARGLAATALERQAEKPGHRNINLEAQQVEPVFHTPTQKKAAPPRAGMMSRNQSSHTPNTDGIKPTRAIVPSPLKTRVASRSAW